MSEMPVLLPMPRTLTRREGRAAIRRGSRLLFGFPKRPLLQHAAADLNLRLRELGRFQIEPIYGDAREPWAHDVSCAPVEGLGAEGYRLSVDPRGIHVDASTPAGVFYGLQTLIQLLERAPEGVSAPAVLVEDTPDFAHRGLFVEDKWGMDRMTLADWKGCIDTLSRLKLNLLGVGVYGCWCIQYEGQVTEFLTVPVPEYPLLRTEKTLRYYSPAKGWQHLTYLPPLFEQDFLGEVVAYGRERNVVVRPHFNSLGHNTLIPRLYPEVSARDRHGEPTGCGYCMSSPRTFEMLFGIYDGIIARYLRPHGVDYFHVGMDEVWPQIGADPRDPHRVVPVWCECPQCAKTPREDLLISFTARLCAHLQEQGIRNISLWNDQFARHMDIVDRLAAGLRAQGVEESVVVQWWHYGLQFPESLRPDLGLRRWVTPMTGYFFWWVYQSLLQNIHGMVRLGTRDGATGVESYCAYDRAFDREITCLAEYAWRSEAGELDGFRERYARALFGERWPDGMRAFAALEAVAEPGPLHSFLRSLCYYPYTYVNKSLPYPRHYPGEPLRAITADPLPAREKLEAIHAHAAEARERFLALRESSQRPGVVAEFAAEAHRIAATAAAFLGLLEALALYQAAVEGDAGAREAGIQQARARVAALLPLHEAMMRDIETAKQEPLLPQTLRDLSAMWKALHELSDRLEAAQASARQGEPAPGVEEVFLRPAGA